MKQVTAYNVSVSDLIWLLFRMFRKTLQFVESEYYTISQVVYHKQYLTFRSVVIERSLRGYSEVLNNLSSIPSLSHTNFCHMINLVRTLKTWESSHVC